MVARPCLTCKRPTRNGSRCGPCSQARQAQQPQSRPSTRARASTAERGYGSQWQRLSRAVLDRDEHTCRYCGQHATTVDHVVPKARGGTDDPGNLVAACRQCNSSKGAR